MSRKKIAVKELKKKAASLKEKVNKKKEEREKNKKKRKSPTKEAGEFGFIAGSWKDRIAQELAKGRFKIPKIQDRLGLKHDTPIKNLIEEAKGMKHLTVKYDGKVPVLKVVKKKKK